ncbi:hypothetical protein [Polymorphospora rubra]|uniref:hypothetical protein n=1 Tax=Polymorphospora rubra TaxID=338584 RepID=UPI0033F80D1A
MTTTMNEPQLLREPELTAQFADHGYVLLRGILDRDEIGRARERIAGLLTGSGEREMLTSEFLAVRELAEIPLRGRIVATIRALIGDEVALVSQLHRPEECLGAAARR